MGGGGGGRLIGIVPKFGCACFKNSGISMALHAGLVDVFER